MKAVLGDKSLSEATRFGRESHSQGQIFKWSDEIWAREPLSRTNL